MYRQFFGEKYGKKFGNFGWKTYHNIYHVKGPNIRYVDEIWIMYPNVFIHEWHEVLWEKV